MFSRRTTNRHTASQRPPLPPKTKQLQFDPQIDRQIQLNEEWRAVANSYLLDSSFPEGIQSLNLKDPQMLEKAVHFVKNPTEDSIKFLCARAQQLSKDFDRYKTSSKKNEYTDMWLRMAIMICRTVEDRLATHPEDLRGSTQVTINQHYRIVTVLLLEVLADWNSPPDSFLRRRYLSDIDGDNEGSGTEVQTGGNAAHAEPRNECTHIGFHSKRCGTAHR
jgi:hypothetical protein